MKKNVRRCTSFLLIIILFAGIILDPAVVTQAANVKTISRALSTKTYKTAPEYTDHTRYLPDFGIWSDYRYPLYKATDFSDYNEVCWKVPASDITDCLNEYATLLQDKRFHLSLIDSHSSQLAGKTYIEYYFSYTGTAKITALDTPPENCHLKLIYNPKKYLCIQYADEFQMIDTFARIGGKTAKNQTIKGTSARKAIQKTSDGSYRTSDKRLSTKAGYADVIVNGKHYKKKVIFQSDATGTKKASHDCFMINDVWRGNDIYMHFPYNYSESGDLYNLSDLYGAGSAYQNDLRLSVTAATGDTTYTSAYTNRFDYATIRIASWKKSGVTVLYFAGKYTDDQGETITLEGLLAGKYKESDANTTKLKKGATKSFTFDRRVSGANYETYAWSIESGSDVISISDKKKATCKVKGKKTGSAVIKVTYTYGVDEPDVLTGNMRNHEHTIVQRYAIKVTN